MIYQSLKEVSYTDGVFRFGENVTAHGDGSLGGIGDVWNNYLHRCGRLTLLDGAENTLVIGEAAPLPVRDAEYTVNVTPDGIALAGSDKHALCRALLFLLDFVRADCLDKGDVRFSAPCFTYVSKPQISTRMVHFCVFPETPYLFFRKFVRLCGVLQFTHIVLEFWGMLRYDCMAELGWRDAWTKDMVRAAVEDAHAYGSEVIPMFNHLGHAAGSRSCSGKHVVLDQNPRLAGLFTEDGWVWAIEKPEVRALLRKVRHELIELCGDGAYFHIGCDEAYCYGSDREKTANLVDYINEIVEDLAACGRKAILWGDMLLKNHGDFRIAENHYYCNCRDDAIEKLLFDGLDRRAVIADWQYDAPTAPFETSLFFKQHGFTTLVCPWESIHPKNTAAAVRTVSDHGMDGYMLTTWHTHERLEALLRDGLLCRGMSVTGIDPNITVGALLRRVWFADGDYVNAGWKAKQVVQRFS